MGELGEWVQATVAPEKQIDESSINIETDYENVGAMDETVEAAAVPDQNKK